MNIGIVREIKNNENRVSMTPEGVKELVAAGHKVVVEKEAGIGSGFADQDYIDAGADMVDHKTAWSQDMVIKVKEPQASEYKFFKKGQILFTYLHLAAEKELTKALLDSGITAIAYETVIGKVGGPRLPLLSPMSEVAGRRSIIIAATYLEKHNGGLGLLPGGVTGTEKGHVTVIGGGVAGYAAAYTAAGLGANVTILEMNEDSIKRLKADDRLNSLAKVFGSKIEVVKSESAALAELCKTTDILISTVLIPGAAAPKVVSEAMVKSMKAGSVIVDISIDQGGSVETITEITTHDKPIIVKHDVQHYSVANMPGATPRTSTAALVNATLPYAKEIAAKGLEALKADEGLLNGLNTHEGKLTFKAVSDAYPEFANVLADAKSII